MCLIFNGGFNKLYYSDDDLGMTHGTFHSPHFHGLSKLEHTSLSIHPTEVATGEDNLSPEFKSKNFIPIKNFFHYFLNMTNKIKLLVCFWLIEKDQDHIVKMDGYYFQEITSGQINDRNFEIFRMNFKNVEGNFSKMNL